jgi:hypothetical protein
LYGSNNDNTINFKPFRDTGLYDGLQFFLTSHFQPPKI